MIKGLDSFKIISKKIETLLIKGLSSISFIFIKTKCQSSQQRCGFIQIN